VFVGSGVLVGSGVTVGGIGVLVGVAVGGSGVAVGVEVGTGVSVGEEPPPPLPPPEDAVVVASGPYEIGGIISLEASCCLVTVSNMPPMAGPRARIDTNTTIATRAIKRLYSSKLWPWMGCIFAAAALIFFILYLVLAII
jgi:hypothetical protein